MTCAVNVLRNNSADTATTQSACGCAYCHDCPITWIVALYSAINGWRVKLLNDEPLFYVYFNFPVSSPVHPPPCIINL